MGKKIELTIPVSQLVFHEHQISFHWENMPLLFSRQDFPVLIPENLKLNLEYFKTTLPGVLHLTITFPWFKAGFELSGISLSAADTAAVRHRIEEIHNFVQAIETGIAKKELDLTSVEHLLQINHLSLSPEAIHHFLYQMLDHLPPQQVMEPLDIPLSTLHYHDQGIEFRINETLMEIPNANLPFASNTYIELIKTFLHGDLTIKFQKERMVKWNGDQGKLETRDVPLKIADCSMSRLAGENFDSAIQNIVKIEKELIAQAEKNTLTREIALQLFRDNGFAGDFARLSPIIATLINRIPPQELTLAHTVLIAQLLPRPDGALFKYRSVYFTIYDSQLKLELYHFPPEFIQFIDGRICAMMKMRRYIYWEEKTGKLNIDKIVLDVESISMDPKEFDLFQRQKFMIAAIAEELDLLIAKNRLTLDKAVELFKNLEFELSTALVNRFLKRYIDEGPQVVSSETHRIPLAELEYGPEKILFRYQGQPYPIISPSFPFEWGPILEEIKSDLPGHIEIFFLHFHHRHWDAMKGEIIVEETAQNLGKWEIPEESVQAFLKFRQTSICNEIKEMLANDILNIEKVQELLQLWGLSTCSRPIADAIIAQVAPWKTQTVSQVTLKDLIYGMDEITIPLSVGHQWRISTKNTRLQSAPSLDHIKQVFKGNIEVKVITPHQFFWDPTPEQLVISSGPSTIQIDMDDDTHALFQKMTAVFVDYCHVLGTHQAINLVLSPLFNFDEPKHLPHTDPQLAEKGYDPAYVRALIDMAEKVYPTQDDLWFKIKNHLVWERPSHGAATYIFKWPEQSLKNFMGTIWSYPTLHEITADRAATGYLGKAIHTTLPEWKAHINYIISYSH